MCKHHDVLGLKHCGDADTKRCLFSRHQSTAGVVQDSAQPRRRRLMTAIDWCPHSAVGRVHSLRSDRMCLSHCLATLRVCQIMYRPKQLCAWHATSEMEFHPLQTGADHGAVLPSPGCTRFVQTVVCPLETPSTAPRIGLCGERTLRPPWSRVDDDNDFSYANDHHLGYM